MLQQSFTVASTQADTDRTRARSHTSVFCTGVVVSMFAMISKAMKVRNLSVMECTHHGSVTMQNEPAPHALS